MVFGSSLAGRKEEPGPTSYHTVSGGILGQKQRNLGEKKSAKCSLQRENIRILVVFEDRLGVAEA
eukprot:51758-Prymnesium_polylepis.1